MLRAWVLQEADALWPGATLLLGFAIAVAVFDRRRAPGLAAAFCFGAVALLEITSRARGLDWEGLDPFIALVVLAYSLPRWGSGAEIAAGGSAMLAAYVLGGGIDFTSPAESLASATVLLFPVALGAVFRGQDLARRRADAESRLRERTELARELHDSVAHHVAAIAVQAQGARALATRRPEVSAEALAAIEESASRALEEMRRVVGALRDDAAAERLPLGTLADIDALAEAGGVGPEVTVTLRGDLDGLDDSLQHTLYSIAREGVTNAIRHAENARTVHVEVSGDPQQLQVSVADDGSSAPPGDEALAKAGFGLRGMRERVALLGGVLEAGARDTGGWSVTARLPR